MPATRCRGIWGSAACAAAIGTAIMCSTAQAAAPHVVQPGETLWSISAANNLTTRTVAVYNGLPEDAMVVEGTTIYVPTVDGGRRGAGRGRAGGVAADARPAGGGSGGSTADRGDGPGRGMGHVPSPYGELQLIPAAADAWNAMRAESLQLYGIDSTPAARCPPTAPTTSRRSSTTPSWRACGAPANPPGTSSHEQGTAVDVETPEMRWVIDQIGWKYGWAKVHGPDEWWHVDYVGG